MIMNFLDIGILIIIALTTIRGFFKGLIKEAAGLLGIIFSFYLASYYYKDLALKAARLLSDHHLLLEIFCFILIFLVSLLICHFLAMMARGAIRIVLLGWLDRILGGIFGLIKGAVIIFFLVTILTVFHPKSSALVKDSRFFPPILTFTGKITLLIPHKIQGDFLNKKRQIQDYWKGKKRFIEKTGKIKGDEESQ
ncbi:MAG: CvpA family protein [Thermodesulfobacteriota bacterium]|jgi:membrane protein required for colicin V production